MNPNISISNFNLLMKIKDKDKEKIPGCPPGYLTPKYYLKERISNQIAKKQDFFALGSTLYSMKYGYSLLKYQKQDDPLVNKDFELEIILREYQYKKSKSTKEKEFIDFVISLIGYNPEIRENFEQIFRNSWLNTNKDYIDDIIHSNENDEEKIIMEL